jgi:hypothetical protein
MRTASIKEFRSELPSLTRQGELVLVTNHGKIIGCFLPIWSNDRDFEGLPGVEVFSTAKLLTVLGV